MYTLIRILISLQLALGAYAQGATPPPPDGQTPPSAATAPIGNTPDTTFTSETTDPDGNTITQETHVIYSENPVETAGSLAEEAGQAAEQGIPVTVVGTTVEGDGSAHQNSIKDTQKEIDEAFRKNTGHNPLNVQIPKSQFQKWADYLNKKAALPLQKLKNRASLWAHEKPKMTKGVFAFTRATINGVVISIVYNYFLCDGTIPGWLAWATGLSLGVLSGSMNYYSDFYSGWLDKPVTGESKVDQILLKLKGILPDDTLNEIKTLSKWMGIQVLFIAVPLLVFYSAGHPTAPTWWDALVGATTSLAISTFGQYPWERGISHADRHDIQKSLDKINTAWIGLRTQLGFMTASVAQNAFTALGLGDNKIAAYTTLIILGLGGLMYRSSVLKRTGHTEHTSHGGNTKGPVNCIQILTPPTEPQKTGDKKNDQAQSTPLKSLNLVA